VRGFTLDGAFVLESHEELYAGSRVFGPNARGSYRFNDLYSVGTKSMLIVPACPGDITEAECQQAFNRDAVMREYGGDIQAYMRAFTDHANAHFATSSFGKFQLSATILPPVRIPGYYASTSTSPRRSAGAQTSPTSWPSTS
jgi:hypothetical protein